MEIVYAQKTPQQERQWIGEYGRAVAALVRSRGQGAVSRAELVGVNEALARGETARPRQEGFAGAVGGFLRGLSEGIESVQGGWGGD